MKYILALFVWAMVPLAFIVVAFDIAKAFVEILVEICGVKTKVKEKI
jgi:hypothetical protein